MSLTVLILTKNEEKMIADCIQSVKWADKIVVIDSESVDGTRSIARKKGAKVFQYPFKDFSDQRNIAAKQAKTDWILYLDADERVSNGLKKQIQYTISDNNAFEAYRLKRENYYFGRQWPHKDHLERLFKRNALKGWSGPVHETPKIEGRIGNLTEPLLHFTHRNLESMLEKTIEWSRIEAQLRYNANHPPVTWWRLTRVAIIGFWNSYVKQRGFSVGTAGLIESMYQAYSMLITYTCLWEIQQEKK